MIIFGVDFSGAKNGKGIWVTASKSTEDKLTFTEVKSCIERDPEKRN